MKNLILHGNYELNAHLPTTCIYHASDLDGHCSGAAIRKYCDAVRMVPANYGDDVLSGLCFRPEEQLVVADFSYKWSEESELLNALDAVGGRLIWVDHHVTAITEFNRTQAPYHFGAVLCTAVAACELVGYLMGGNERWSTTATRLGIYDTWRFDAAGMERIWAYQYGMRAMLGDPGTTAGWALWQAHLPHESTALHEQVHEIGGKIRRYHQQLQLANAKFGAFNTQLWAPGLPPLDCVALVGGQAIGGSTAFEAVFDASRHDAMLYLCMDSLGVWNASLYTPTAGRDVSEYAKAAGGGGHHHACGFRLPFGFVPGSPEMKIGK